MAHISLIESASFRRLADDEYESRGRKGGRQKTDYSRPVGFVSSGVIKHGDDEEEGAAKEEGELGCL